MNKRLSIPFLVTILTTIFMEGTAMTMELKSGAFSHEGMIPKKYTCSGEDFSPPLSWSQPPAGTKSICIIADDPDAPVGTWVHWVIYNIPPDKKGLEENVPKVDKLGDGTLQGINDFRRVGYGGPCPPPGPAHRYFFKIYALDTKLSLPPNSTKEAVERAMSGHILDKGVLMGRFGR